MSCGVLPFEPRSPSQAAETEGTRMAHGMSLIGRNFAPRDRLLSSEPARNGWIRGRPLALPAPSGERPHLPRTATDLRATDDGVRAPRKAGRRVLDDRERPRRYWPAAFRQTLLGTAGQLVESLWTGSGVSVVAGRMQHEHLGRQVDLGVDAAHERPHLAAGEPLDGLAERRQLRVLK
jgi:hypothetical protein